MILIIVVLLTIFGDVYTSCYSKKLFSTKTPYSLVQNLDITIKRPSEQCTPVHINMIHRHGHRYPSIKDMKNMMEVGDIINAANPTHSNIKLPWKLPYTFEQDKILTSVGESELFGIGKRIVARFPEIFEQKYTPFNFTFQSTCKLRCTHSAISLAAGLFDGKGHLGKGKYQPISLETYPCGSDKVLRFFDHCEKYLDYVVDKNADKQEMKNFQKTPMVKMVIDKVKKKLMNKSENDIPLKPKHLKVIMVMCAYELAMHGGDMNSGLCSLLDEEDHLVGEYLIDLKHFYARSAGFKINYESACPLLNDFVTTIRQFVSSPKDGKIGVFRSAHAETIIPLFALLNVSLDSIPMRSDNFDELTVRRFRGACLSPFSGNLYFVLYNCSGTVKVQFYINEQLVKLPCCQSSVDCDLTDFLEHYGKMADGCHFEHICRIRDEL